MIFFIIPYNKIGGAEKVHLEIIRSVYQHKRIIICFYDTDGSPISEDFSNIATIFILNSNLKKKLFTSVLISISYIFPITVFGCNSDHFYTLLPKIAKSSATVDLTHAFAFPDIGKEDIALNYIPLINKRIVINKRTLTDYENEYKAAGIDKNYLRRFQIIPNGIPINEFDPSLIDERFSKFKIGFVGRYSPEKRPELFLTLASSEIENGLMAKMIVDDFKLSKSDYVNIELVEGLTDAISVRKEFSDISVLIVPSLREGFPLVIMEAMELGIPVISTAVGSIEEHLENGKNGFISKSIDSDDFLKFCSEKIHLLAENKELYSKLSFSARIYAEEKFNINDFHKAYRSILLDVTK
ncbi:MAG: glycosyltransferase family 4 protein [Lentimicrobiaceae bacterium]|jgi:glycosyltransferase involved in cell wall biosynthesis